MILQILISLCLNIQITRAGLITSGAKSVEIKNEKTGEVVKVKKKEGISPPTLLQCSNSGRATGVATSQIQYIGSLGWPKSLHNPFRCNYKLEISAHEPGSFLKLSFIDFKTDCSERSRMKVFEAGVERIFRICGKLPIEDYIAKTGSAEIHLDFGQDAQVLISFELIPGLPPKPIPVALQTTRAPPALVQKLLPNYYAPTQSTIPELRTKYHPAPPVIIKSVRDESFYQPDTAIVGKRNLLLTMIFCSLGIISLCGAVYLVRKYTLESQEEDNSQVDLQVLQQNMAHEAEMRRLEDTRLKYEGEVSTKLEARYR